MRYSIETLVEISPASRRLAWRIGRRIYCAARGEPRINAIEINGEAYVQACVSRAVPIDTPLRLVDIGANQGEWCLSMIKSLPLERRQRGNFKIDVFEPVASTVARLQTALADAVAVDLAYIHQVAVSDAPGTAEIAVMSETGGTNTLHPNPDSGPPIGGTTTVETVTLSQFCLDQGLSHIHLAKCDTEGHDIAVLRGACELLAAGRIDVFQFEYNHRWIYSRSYLKDVFDLIARLPYNVARIMPTRLEVLPAWHPELERFFEANYLLVRKAALGWFNITNGQFHASNTYA